MKITLRVLGYARPYWVLGLISLFTTVLDSGINLLAPWPLKILVDNVLGGQKLPGPLGNILGPLADGRTALLVVAVVAGLGITAMANLLTVFANYVNTRLEQRTVLDIRSALFKATQKLGPPYHDNRDYGRMMYGVNFEAEAAGGVIMALQPMLQSGLTLVGMFWVSYQIDHELALISLIILPALYYSVGIYTNHVEDRLVRVRNMEFGTLSIIHEAMSLLRVVTAFRREDYEHDRYYAQGQRAVDARVDVTVRQTAFSLAVNMTTAVGTALVLGFGAYHALHGELTAGQLLVIMSYTGYVYQPLEAISFTLGTLQSKFIGLALAFELLDMEPEVQEQPDAIHVPNVRGALTFDSVHFSYPGRAETLADISFTVDAGQVVALVGPTGAGKTTLMGLIPRFYDPSEGRVLLDGHDVRDLTLDSLRGNISIVLQEPALFSGTIADNIRYGRLDATDEEIAQAAMDANAHEFIMALPEQYATEVGERGVKLSGGERQRICVARAFLKDAPILILDEPTSAIDSRTESVILDALDRLMVGRTTFMIAHRLSTVRHSDLILVLDHGHLVEHGTHEQLMQNHGLYKQLYDVQIGQRKRHLRLRSAGDPEEETGLQTVNAGGPSHQGVPPPSRDNGSRLWDEVMQIVQSEDERDLQSDHSSQQSLTLESRAMAASYTSDPPAEWIAGERAAYDIHLTNAGNEGWICKGPNPVYLCVSFGGESDRLHDGWITDQRFPLATNVAPGESVTMTIELDAPVAPGIYTLRHRLVREGLAWFDDFEKATVLVADPVGDQRREPKGLSASYRHDAPATWYAEDLCELQVTVQNTGAQQWNCAGENPVLLAIHFGGESDWPHDGWVTDQRFSLPGDVDSGAEAVIQAQVQAPLTPGEYVLRCRMVQENVCWFDQVAKMVVRVAQPTHRRGYA